MNRLDSQNTYWDSVATKKTFTHPVRIDLLRDILPHGARILDYGCGYGRTCAFLRENGYHRVVGVDISSEMIARGLRSDNTLDLRHIKGAPLPFAESSCDACTLLAVLNCIPTDNGQRMLINELRRVLRPGGILYLSDYPLQKDEKNLDRYNRFETEFEKFGIFQLPDSAVLRHHDMDWIYTLLAQFDIFWETNIDVLTMNGSRADIFQIMARKKQAHQIS